MTQEVPGDPGPEAGLPIVIGRLIGPAGPALGCDECFAQLDAYVELELAGAQAGASMPAMRAHLLGCPVCRDDHDSLLAFVLADPPDSQSGNLLGRAVICGVLQLRASHARALLRCGHRSLGAWFSRPGLV